MTNHAEIKRAGLLAVQRAVPGVTIHNHPSGTFVPVHVITTALKAMERGDFAAIKNALKGSARVTVNYPGRFDVGLEFVGGLYACVEFKGPGDKLSPAQIKEAQRMTNARIPHHVCQARTVEEIPAAVRQLCEWAVTL